MSDEVKKLIKDGHKNIKVGLAKIADYSKLAPGLQAADEAFSMMEESIDNAPPEAGFVVDETLVDYLTKTNFETGIFNELPPVTPAMVTGTTASGTADLDVYTQYVQKTASAFPENPGVTEWARITIVKYEEFREKQNRSVVVHQRLIQLNPEFGDLHQMCITSSLAAQAGTQNPVEAAQNQDRLLERFKGQLLQKCRGGTGKTYSRISDYLAADSPLTKTIVADGQTTYERLHSSYIDVRKSMNPSTGIHLVELLRELEDHIYNITNALDPAKVGIAFYT
jgi:hypothetical protein